nr:hypothetical protein [Tanacetum cinerariifolium]
MIAVNNRRDLMSPSPLVAKPKKGKSQTVTLTSPKSQVLEASRALSKKIKRPMDITFTTPDEGTAKTMPCLEGSHGDKDSGGNKPPTNLEPQNLTDVDLLGTGAKYQKDQTQSSRLRYYYWKRRKYDDTLPLTKRQLVKYLRKVSCVLFERITKDQWEKHEEAAVHYVVHKKEKKFGIHLKEAITTKAGELFKKAQEAEHEVLKRQHTEKSALPPPEQAPSQTSGRKQKHIGLKPETRIPRLECNRTLPENVLFIKNTIIKEPEYGIFFTDKLGDQAFQRWSDIDKVRMEALVSYLVAATMVKSPENARFSMKLRKLIAEHLDQEKLKSNKVKLEALEYNME